MALPPNSSFFSHPPSFSPGSPSVYASKPARQAFFSLFARIFSNKLITLLKASKRAGKAQASRQFNPRSPASKQSKQTSSQRAS
jgi:hypothetical protein